MLIPLEEFMTPLEDSYFLHIFFAFLYILCTFKIIFLLIITITTSCNKTLDILKYFTMILICRIVQKKTLLNRQFSNVNKLLAVSSAHTTNTKYGTLTLFCRLEITAVKYNIYCLMFKLRQHLGLLDCA